jgi:hypothetical protein
MGFDVDNHGLRSCIEQMIREMLPSSTINPIDADHATLKTNESSVAAIQEELDAARKALEKLKDEKILQEREMFLKDELRALGVRNVDLAFRAVRDDIGQSDSKEWVATIEGQSVPAVQFLKQFVSRNPELMPARMISGGGTPSRMEEYRGECDLDQIRPGMDPATMRRAREAVVKIIAQSKRAL